MGKKSRSPSTGATAVNGNASSRSAPAPKAVVATTTSMEPESAIGGRKAWTRMKRSLIGMLFLGGLALTDPLMLKECFTVAAPDHKPLLAFVVLFAWVIWKRWGNAGKTGLHPLFRAMGFLIILVAVTSLLPFNSTVTMYEVPLLTPEECGTLSEAAAATIAEPIFVPTVSRFDPMAEVPLEDLPSKVSSMIYEALRQKLLPFASLEYGGQGNVFLEEGSFYVEHYEGYHEPVPKAHIRHQQLAVRVELTPPESRYVGGGGVVLETMGRTVTPGMGNALLLPAKLRHGSSELGSSPRSVLVGTLTVRGRDPWQRFIGMWRLWGFLSRRVRYIADKQLSSSGVDTIAVPLELEAKEALEREGGAAGAFSDAEGNRLEF